MILSCLTRILAGRVYSSRACFNSILTLRTLREFLVKETLRGAMRFKVMGRLYSLRFSTLLTLVVWGVVALAGTEPVTWDPLDNDAPEGVTVLEMALPSLPSLPSPLVLPQERVERVSAKSPSRSYCPTLHLSTSCGVPAETGKDLLAYLEISRT